MKSRKPALPLEAEIQKACLQYLNLQPGVRCWRQNTGAFAGDYKGKKRFVRYGITGQSDISGIMLPGGRRIEIEVKRPGNVPTEDQAAWLAMIREHGGVAFWIDSLDKCMELFMRYKDFGVRIQTMSTIDYGDLPF